MLPQAPHTKRNAYVFEMKSYFFLKVLNIETGKLLSDMKANPKF